MLSTVPAEVRAFCEATTVRGIPRILKAKTKVMFILWLVAVLTCAAILIWQLSIIFIRYAGYPITTLVQELGMQDPTFPEITICNAFPLSHGDETNMRYAEYARVLIRTFQRRNATKTFSDIEPQMLSKILSYLVTPMAFYNNFPIVYDIEPNRNQSLIIDCAYFDWYYGLTDNDCWSHVRTVWDPDYYKCHTLRLNKSESNTFRGFSAVLYVDDFPGYVLTPFSMSPKDSRASGVRILVHPTATKPDMKLGISISPGMETTISLKQTQRTRLPAPYSNCTTQKYVNPDDFIYNYDSSYCRDVCLQQKLLKKCGCVWSELQFSRSQFKEAGDIVCGNVSVTSVNSSVSSVGMHRIECAMEFDYDNALKACEDLCPLPCNEIYYETTVSSVPWPHVSSHGSFYTSYIQDNPRFGNKFDAYEPIGEQDIMTLTNINAKIRKLLALLDAEGLIRKNFLYVKIMFETYTFNDIRDNPAFSFDAMGASIGGTLSLWLGVTVMFIFEIFEFIYTVLTNWMMSKRMSLNETPATK